MSQKFNELQVLKSIDTRRINKGFISEALTGARAILPSDQDWLSLDPNGSDRIIQLPDATLAELPLGFEITIYNSGVANDLLVQDGIGTLIKTIKSKIIYSIKLEAKTNAAGVWVETSVASSIGASPILYWDTSVPYSTFYADNNIATLTKPTDVFLVNVGGFGIFTWDAGSYANTRLLTFKGTSTNNLQSTIIVQEGAVSTGGIPNFDNVYVDFRCTATPFVTLQDANPLDLNINLIINKSILDTTNSTVAPITFGTWSSAMTLYSTLTDFGDGSNPLFNINSVGTLEIYLLQQGSFNANTISGSLATFWIYNSGDSYCEVNQPAFTGTLNAFSVANNYINNSFSPNQTALIGSVINYSWGNIERLYVCTKTHITPNSGVQEADFVADAANWRPISTPTDWTTGGNIPFLIGETTIYNNQIYKCVVNHLSTVSFVADAGNWQLIGGATVPTSTLVWDSAQTFSQFYAANSVATLTYFTNVIFTDSLAQAFWTMDAGSYSNLDRLKVYGGIKYYPSSQINFEDNVVFTDNQMPEWHNCYLVFNTATVPILTINNSPYNYYFYDCVLNNQGTIAPFLVGQNSGNATFSLKGSCSIYSGGYELIDVQAGSIGFLAQGSTDIGSNVIRGSASGTVYAGYEIHTYIAIQANFAGSFQLFLSPEAIALHPFTGSDPYSVNELVSFNGRQYRSLTSHYSPSVGPADNDNFLADALNWTTTGETLPWFSGIPYLINDMTTDNAKLYKCVTAHMSTTSLQADLINWQLIGAPAIPDPDQLIWDNANTFSTFYIINNLATRAGAPVEVLLYDSQNTNIWTIDSSTYTNIKTISRLTCNYRYAEARIDVQDGATFDYLPNMKGCSYWFATQTVPFFSTSSVAADFTILMEQASMQVEASCTMAAILFDSNRTLQINGKTASFTGNDVYEIFDLTSASAYLFVALYDDSYFSNSAVRGTAGQVYVTSYSVGAVSLIDQPNFYSTSQMFFFIIEQAIKPATYYGGSYTYLANQIITFNGRTYTTVAGFTTSGPTTDQADFLADAANFTSSGQTLPWVTAITYLVGDIVVVNAQLYRCTTAHTASALFVTDVADWELLSASSSGPVRFTAVDMTLADFSTPATDFSAPNINYYHVNPGITGRTFTFDDTGARGGNELFIINASATPFNFHAAATTYDWDGNNISSDFVIAPFSTWHMVYSGYLRVEVTAGTFSANVFTSGVLGGSDSKNFFSSFMIQGDGLTLAIDTNYNYRDGHILNIVCPTTQTSATLDGTAASMLFFNNVDGTSASTFVIPNDNKMYVFKMLGGYFYQIAPVASSSAPITRYFVNSTPYNAPAQATPTIQQYRLFTGSSAFYLNADGNDQDGNIVILNSETTDYISVYMLDGVTATNSIYDKDGTLLYDGTNTPGTAWQLDPGSTYELICTSGSYRLTSAVLTGGDVLYTEDWSVSEDINGLEMRYPQASYRVLVDSLTMTIPAVTNLPDGFIMSIAIQPTVVTDTIIDGTALGMIWYSYDGVTTPNILTLPAPTGGKSPVYTFVSVAGYFRQINNPITQVAAGQIDLHSITSDMTLVASDKAILYYTGADGVTWTLTLNDGVTGMAEGQFLSVVNESGTSPIIIDAGSAGSVMFDSDGNNIASFSVAPGTTSLWVNVGGDWRPYTNTFLNKYLNQTTDATPIVLTSIAASNYTVFSITSEVIAKQSDLSNVAKFKRTIFFKNIAGTISLVSGSSTGVDIETLAPVGWLQTFVINGTNIDITVQGVAATTIDWVCKYEICGLN